MPFATRTLAALAAAGAALTLSAQPAEAWWRGGVFIGVPPVIIGAPAYYPPAYYPPAYYPAPAPYYYPAPAYAPQAQPQSGAQSQAQANVPYGSTCSAGFYSCVAPAQSHVGTGCSCPGIGAPSFGTVR